MLCSALKGMVFWPRSGKRSLLPCFLNETLVCWRLRPSWGWLFSTNTQKIKQPWIMQSPCSQKTFYAFCTIHCRELQVCKWLHVRNLRDGQVSSAAPKWRLNLSLCNLFGPFTACLAGSLFLHCKVQAWGEVVPPVCQCLASLVQGDCPEFYECPMSTNRILNMKIMKRNNLIINFIQAFYFLRYYHVPAPWLQTKLLRILWCWRVWFTSLSIEQSLKLQ